MPTRRKILFGLISLALLAIVVQYWLSTGPARRFVLAALTQVFSGHVEVEKVSLRWKGGLVLKQVRLHESPRPDSRVACDIPRIELKGSLWDLLRSRFRPDEVLIRKATLQLSYDTTRGWTGFSWFRESAQFDNLPLPPVVIQDSSIELHLDGWPHGTEDLRLQKVQLKTNAAGSSELIRLEGRAEIADGTVWGVTGTFLRTERKLQARVRSSPIQLTSQYGDFLPLELADTWRQLDLRGRATIDAQVAWQPGPDGLQYQFLIDPIGLSAYLPPLLERVEDLAGRVEVTPERVRVHALVGRFGSGQVTVAGTFARDSSKSFDLTAEATRVPLHMLGPKLLNGIAPGAGSLSGKLNLRGTASAASWHGEFDGNIEDGERRRDSVPLHLTVQDNEVQLRDLEFSWDGGRFETAARATLDSAAVVTGSMKFKDANLRSLAGLVRGPACETHGMATGAVSFQIPLRGCGDVSQWQWHGPIRIRNARFDRLDVPWLDGTIRCADGALTLDDGTGNLFGQTLRGTVRIGLAAPLAISANYRMAPVPLSELANDGPAGNSAIPIGGLLHATGKLSGQLNPLAIRTTGTATIQNLSVGERQCGSPSMQYALAGAGFDFSEIETNAYDGRLRVRGRWNFPSSTADDSPANLSNRASAVSASPQLRLLVGVDDVDLTQVANEFNAPQPLTGRMSGTVHVEIPQSGPRSTGRAIRASGTVRSTRLASSLLELTDFRADFELAEGLLELKSLSARHMAGSVTGAATLNQTEGGSTLTARLTSTQLDIGRLIPQLANSRAPAVRGKAAGNVAVQWNLTTNSLRGTGNVRLSELRLDELPVIDSVITNDFELVDERIVLKDFQASLWGGTARGTATVDVSATPSPLAEIVIERLESVDLSRIVVVWPAGSTRPRGRLSGAGKLQVATNGDGVAVFGLGQFDLKSALIAGLPITDAEGTIEAFDAATHEVVSGRVQPRRTGAVARLPDQRLWIRARNARAARGGLQGTIQVSLVKPAAYDANLQFVGLDLATVVQSAFASPYTAAGSLSGNLQLRGSARGPMDTRGEMRLRLQNAQLWSIPPFAVLAKLITLDLTKPGGFHTAEVQRAVIQGDVIDLQEFWLAGDLVQLAGSGRIQMDGRLDVAVVSSLKGDAGRNLPILGQLTKAIRGIQERLVKFHVTGTVSDPMVVPVPLQDLSEPAIKVLNRLTGSLFDNEERAVEPRR